MNETPFTRLHGTSVSWQGQGVLILGSSGGGKSSLALHLMALGCDLVADDQSEVFERQGHLIATCPKAIKNQIEARGFGILDAKAAPETQLVCVIDLDIPEKNRLPKRHIKEIWGVKLQLFHNPGTGALPFALLQYLKSSSLAKPIA